MNDRIRLAEAMKIPYRANDKGTFYIGLPDPFTDANDDYAVLVWMRETYQRVAWKGTEPQRRCWTLFCQNLPDCRDYQIGDYARAALKVIE